VAAVALLVAAGEGRRLGADRPKAFVELVGRPLFRWALDALLAAPSVGEVVVALPPAEAGRLAAQLPEGVKGVAGGGSRSESVRNALAAAGEGEVVVVHDAARPLVEVALIEAVVGTAQRPGAGGAVCAAPVVETVKEASREGEQLRVVRTLERSALWAVQTPQAFPRHHLAAALAGAQAGELAKATDDASLVERLGLPVYIVENRAPNPKVTTPLDLELCSLLLLRRRRAAVR